MGRTKREYKKIQNYQSLMVTFSKRRNGVIKKAYELGVLCEVDVALLVISPSGKVTPFSINSRMEDIIAKYINIPDDIRGIRIENPGQLLETLERIKHTDDQTAVSEQITYSSSSNSNDNTKIEELNAMITRLGNKREALLQCLRNFYGDHDVPVTRQSLEWRQNMILTALACVNERKSQLLQQCTIAPLQHGYCTIDPLQQEYTSAPFQLEYGTTAPLQQECTTAPLQQENYSSISPSHHECIVAPLQQECTTLSNVNQQGLLQPHFNAQNTDRFNQEDPCQDYLMLPDDGDVGTIDAETAPATMDHMFEGFNATDQTMEKLFEDVESYDFNNTPSYNINNLQSCDNFIPSYDLSNIDDYNFNNIESSHDFNDITPLWCHDL